jgi:TrmH family RNA methyltransferase
VALERLTAANDYYQLTLALVDNRKQRQRQKRFVVQSVKAIGDALERGWSFESLWIREGARLSSWAQDVIDRAGARRTISARVELFAALHGKEDPGELVAVLDLPADRLADATLRDPALVVVCDRPSSPGNLGSIVRSADAFGASALIVTGHAADIYDPQTVRASLGALFALPVAHVQSPSTAVEWLRERCPPIRLVGTSAHAVTPLEDYDFRAPVALLLGSEATGLSRWWTEAADGMVTIPTAGVATSLNVAAAATAVLNEVRRQRASSP